MKPSPAERIPPDEVNAGLSDFASEADRGWQDVAVGPSPTSHRFHISARLKGPWFVPVVAALILGGILLIGVVSRPEVPAAPTAVEVPEPPSAPIAARHTSYLSTLATRVSPRQPTTWVTEDDSATLRESDASLVARAKALAFRASATSPPRSSRASPEGQAFRPGELSAPTHALNSRSLAEGSAALAAPSVPSRAAVATPDETDAEVSAVLQTVNEYANAYERLDVDAASEVWPSVDRRALARAFGTLRSQAVRFESCLVDQAASMTAVVRCHGIVEFVRRVGGTTPRAERQQWVFTLRRDGDDWRIADVRTSPAQSARDPS